MHVELYLDHRNGADNYPAIALCDGCADGLGGNVGALTRLEPGQAAVCEGCGRRNAARHAFPSHVAARDGTG